MAEKQWSVEIGFNRFDGCPKKHKAFEICDGCEVHQGVVQMKVPAGSSSQAVCNAMDKFSMTPHAAAGYQVVTVTLDGDTANRLPRLPQASSDKQRGKGQRKP